MWVPSINRKWEAVILVGAFSFQEAVQLHEDLSLQLAAATQRSRHCSKCQHHTAMLCVDPAVTYIEAGGKFSQLSPLPSESFKKARQNVNFI